MEQLGTTRYDDCKNHWAHLERVTKDRGKSEHLVSLFIFKQLPLHITCTGLSQTSLSEKGLLVQQLALSGSPGQGQSPGTAAFRGAGGQGTTAGETLLHKEFMRAKKLGQGMHRSRDLRKISTGGSAESGHHWTKVPDLFFHRTVPHQIYVSSYRFHVTLSFQIQQFPDLRTEMKAIEKGRSQSGLTHYLYQGQ